MKAAISIFCSTSTLLMDGVDLLDQNTKCTLGVRFTKFKKFKPLIVNFSMKFSVRKENGYSRAR